MIEEPRHKLADEPQFQTVMGRLRKDAVGWEDPPPVMGKRPRGLRDVWLRDVTQKVRVVVVRTTHEPLLLVSTDIALFETAPNLSER